MPEDATSDTHQALVGNSASTGRRHPRATPEHRDIVHGNLVQFSDNGAWSWYSDERALVDSKNQTLFVGFDQNGAGFGGAVRDGDVTAHVFDIASMTGQSHLMKDEYLTSFAGGAPWDPTACVDCKAGDDHSAPAFLALPDKSYLAVYAGHNNDNYSYYRFYKDGVWSDERSFDWNTIPGGTNFAVTYSNLFYLADEGRIYNIARSNNKSPNIIYSDDLGETWQYGGQVTATTTDVGYVNGYFKYWSNGRDRIDFICTEHHPRDFNTSIYHGYIKGGKTYDTYGKLLDENVFDQQAPKAAEFSPVFQAGTVVGGVAMTRAWTIELVTYDDGTIASVFETRADDNDMDHRFFYTNFNGATWHTTYLGKAGPKLYDSEEDYVGLGSVDPSDPYTIYISTTFDPRDDRDLGVHEIFKGVSSDEGATWTWYPITENSSCDNLRPIVPKWDDTNTALLWFRGTYYSYQIMDAAVVGIFDMPEINVGGMHYRDASRRNTFVADGEKTRGLGGWHVRHAAANHGTVLASADRQAEDAPMLKTVVSPHRRGIYDVWVNFWADPESDWRVRAGLTRDQLHTYRQMASQQVLESYHVTPVSTTMTLVRLASEDGDVVTSDAAVPASEGSESTNFDASDGEIGQGTASTTTQAEAPVVQSGTVSSTGKAALYQAYLGRVDAGPFSPIVVFVDDDPMTTRTAAAGYDSVRTWYDGVSYAPVARAEHSFHRNDGNP